MTGLLLFSGVITGDGVGGAPPSPVSAWHRWGWQLCRGFSPLVPREQLPWSSVRVLLGEPTGRAGTEDSAMPLPLGTRVTIDVAGSETFLMRNCCFPGRIRECGVPGLHSLRFRGSAGKQESSLHQMVSSCPGSTLLALSRTGRLAPPRS